MLNWIIHRIRMITVFCIDVQQPVPVYVGTPQVE